MPAFRQLRTTLDQPKEDVLRGRVLELLSRESGQPLKTPDNGTDLRRAYQPVLDWFVTKYPGLARDADADDSAPWAAQLIALRPAPPTPVVQDVDPKIDRDVGMAWSVS